MGLCLQQAPGLYLQGHCVWTIGIRVRPSYASQAQVFEVLHGILTGGQGLCLHALPDIVKMDEDDLWVDDMSRCHISFLEKTHHAGETCHDQSSEEKETKRSLVAGFTSLASHQQDVKLGHEQGFAFAGQRQACKEGLISASGIFKSG